MRRRNSTRLFSHNYAWKNWFFVTINTSGRDCIFGTILNNSMLLSKFGEIARDEWLRTEHIRRNIQLDEFIIMPDHIHGLIKIKYEIKNKSFLSCDDRDVLQNDSSGVLPLDGMGVLPLDGMGVLQYAHTTKEPLQTCSFCTSTNQNNNFRSPSNTLGAVIRGYKGAVTKQINLLRNTPGFPVWQRNYYDRIIRTEKELMAVRKYIRNNPMKAWSTNHYGS